MNIAPSSLNNTERFIGGCVEANRFNALNVIFLGPKLAIFYHMEKTKSSKVINFKRVALIVLLSGFSTVTLAANSCLNEELLKNERVPVCSSKSEITIPDASKPTGAIFLSLIVSRNEETIVKTFELIEKYTPMAKLNLLVSNDAMTSFSNYAAYCKPSGNEGFYEYLCKLNDILKLKDKINLIVLSKKTDQVYPQDYLQFGIKDNFPILLPTVNPRETQDYINADGSPMIKTFIQDDVANQCMIKSSSLGIANTKGFSSTMGGNIESLPFGISVMGKGKNEDISQIEAMSDDQLFKQLRGSYPPNIIDVMIKAQIKDLRNAVITYKEQRSFIFKNTGNFKTLNTSLTPVGHADEIFSIVKSNAKCGFSIMVPSPVVALFLLKQSIQNESKENCISKSFNGRPTFDGIDKSSLRKHTESGCVGFRGKTASEILSDDELIKLNTEFDSYTEENIKIIKESLSTKECSELDIIKLPYLILKSDQADSEGIVPNPVNALVITPMNEGVGSVYINNPTFVKIFDEYIDLALTKRGLILEKVYSPDYFSGQGGLHCGSSTIQLCRQK